MEDEAISLGESLRGVIRSLRPGDTAAADVAAIGGVFEHWDEAVGPAIASHVRPVRLDGAQLLVEVDEPAWATQVKFFSATIIERLAEVAGATVDTVAVRVSSPGGGSC